MCFTRHLYNSCNSALWLLTWPSPPHALFAGGGGGGGLVVAFTGDVVCCKCCQQVIQSFTGRQAERDEWAAVAQPRAAAAAVSSRCITSNITHWCDPAHTRPPAGHQSAAAWWCWCVQSAHRWLEAVQTNIAVSQQLTGTARVQWNR